MDTKKMKNEKVLSENTYFRNILLTFKRPIKLSMKSANVPTSGYFQKHCVNSSRERKANVSGKETNGSKYQGYCYLYPAASLQHGLPFPYAFR